MIMTSKRWLWSLNIAALLVAALLTFHYLHKPQSTAQTKPALQTQIKVPTKTSQPLTADGNPIPADSQARAKSTGYYCPSWDTPPGSIASTICVPVDK